MIVQCSIKSGWLLVTHTQNPQVTPRHPKLAHGEFHCSDTGILQNAKFVLNIQDELRYLLLRVTMPQLRMFTSPSVAAGSSNCSHVLEAMRVTGDRHGIRIPTSSVKHEVRVLCSMATGWPGCPTMAASPNVLCSFPWRAQPAVLFGSFVNVSC